MSPATEPSPDPAASIGFQLVDSKKAAELLGISLRTLWELQATRKIPSLTIGRRRLFDLADLRAFVDAAKKGGAR